MAFHRKWFHSVHVKTMLSSQPTFLWKLDVRRNIQMCCLKLFESYDGPSVKETIYLNLFSPRLLGRENMF